jgi:hypothetical protein
MAQPPSDRPIFGDDLQELLTKGRADPAFRRRLLTSPQDTLREEGLRPSEHWVKFFRGMDESDFEEKMDTQIGILEGITSGES